MKSLFHHPTFLLHFSLFWVVWENSGFLWTNAAGLMHTQFNARHGGNDAPFSASMIGTVQVSVNGVLKPG